MDEIGGKFLCYFFEGLVEGRLRRKVDFGCDFFQSQMLQVIVLDFFDSFFYMIFIDKIIEVFLKMLVQNVGD